MFSWHSQLKEHHARTEWQKWWNTSESLIAVLLFFLHNFPLDQKMLKLPNSRQSISSSFSSSSSPPMSLAHSLLHLHTKHLSAMSLHDSWTQCWILCSMNFCLCMSSHCLRLTKIALFCWILSHYLTSSFLLILACILSCQILVSDASQYLSIWLKSCYLLLTVAFFSFSNEKE